MERTIAEDRSPVADNVFRITVKETVDGNDIRSVRRGEDRHAFPDIDINRSATRKEELLIDETDLNRIWILCKVLSQLSEVEAMELLVEKLSKTKTNEDFLAAMSKGL